MAGIGDQNVVELKIDQLTTAQKAIVSKVDDMSDKLLDPERGLFAKVKDVDAKSDENAEKIDEVKSNLDTLVDVCTRNEKRTVNLERWAEDHERRDEELRENIKGITNAIKPLSDDFARRERTKKWTDKILWLVVAAIITGLLPTVKYMIFDAPVQTEKLEKLEQIMIEQDNVNRRLRRRSRDDGAESTKSGK